MDAPVTIDLARIATELGLTRTQIENVVALLDEGNTIPFITRYRKERTGNLDEERLRQIQERVTLARQLQERGQTILRLIETQGKLTPELRREIEGADSLKRLEDLYLPYRPKKRSRASIARDRGLEPLADRIWRGDVAAAQLTAAAQGFVDPAKEVADADAALQGASDLLAERIGDHAEVRAAVRKTAWSTGKLVVSSADKNPPAESPYRDYFQYAEGVAKIPPHRVLALNRGEHESVLRIKFEWDDARARDSLDRVLRFDQHPCREFLGRSAGDALDRLIQPSLERELRRELTEKAEIHAVSVFAKNLRQLLLQKPVQGRRVLAIDPGFRTGCKIAVLDEIGTCLATDVIYTTGGAEKRTGVKAKLAALLLTHGCTLIAIGNGTACRETEELVAEVIAESAPEVQYVIVNEAGASIYSASTVAREEFPDLDATLRGTISIGRRLQDPLSELVKIEPQHIGVGMYQHDVSAKELKESLEHVVESCVNFVGVDLNTASPALLGRVSGLNALTARRVVEWRNKHGRFAQRAQLRDVAGVGDTTFTQAAGFLKITGGDEPLDATWIHPESYPAARQLLARAPLPPEQRATPQAWGPVVKEWITTVDRAALAAELQVGELTLNDIIDALVRPGRDPRTDLPGHLFKQGILKLEDLQLGMELRGTVLNVVDFGAFVDVGLKDSGLVHISQMSTQYVRSPHDHCAVGDVITVWVLGIDLQRRRVSLTMINPAAPPAAKPSRPAASPAPAPAPTSAPAKPAAPPPRPAAEAAPAPPRKPKAPAAPPLSADKSSGATPLRGFDELKQLWNKRP